MRKSVLIAIGAVVIIVAGIIIVIMSSQSQQSTNTNNNSNTQTPAPTKTKAETTNAITIKDMNFSPTKTTVTRGTTVTWTNQDDVGHNVIASDPSHTGGLPTSAPLLKKGETFSFTFNELGNFAYRCAPHAFMRGAIEVIEQ